MQERTIKILLVEDNPGDIRLMKEALKETNIPNSVHSVRDGEQAIEYLFSKKELPDLILLDINLPKLNGLEVLEKIKTDETLKVIPVVIITSSNSEEDVQRSYKNYANCFITKPLNMNQFLQVVSAIDNFWLSVARLPMEKRKIS